MSKAGKLGALDRKQEGYYIKICSTPLRARISK